MSPGVGPAAVIGGTILFATRIGYECVVTFPDAALEKTKDQNLIFSIKVPPAIVDMDALEWARNNSFDSWFDVESSDYLFASYCVERDNDIANPPITCEGQTHTCWKIMKDDDLPFKNYRKTTWVTRLLNPQNFGGSNAFSINDDGLPAVMFELQGWEISKKPIKRIQWAIEN